MLDRIFRKGKLKLRFVEEANKNDAQDKKEKCSAVTVVSIHGMNLMAPIDSDTTLKELLSAVAKHLTSDWEQSTKTVMVADGSGAMMKGKVAKVPVLLEFLKIKMDFVVTQNVSFDLLIGHPTLTLTGCVPDFRTEEFCLDYRGQQTPLPVILEYYSLLDASRGTDSEDVTSGSELSENDYVDVQEEAEESKKLVLCRRDGRSQ